MCSGLMFAKVLGGDAIVIPAKQTVIGLHILHDTELTGDTFTPKVIFGFNEYQNKIQTLILFIYFLNGCE